MFKNKYDEEVKKLELLQKEFKERVTELNEQNVQLNTEKIEFSKKKEVSVEVAESTELKVERIELIAP